MRFLVQIIEIHIHIMDSIGRSSINRGLTEILFQINEVQYDCIIFYYQQHMYFATYLDRKGFKTL